MRPRVTRDSACYDSRMQPIMRDASVSGCHARASRACRSRQIANMATKRGHGTRSKAATVAFTIILCCPSAIGALEHVTVRHDGREQLVSGQVLVTAKDGGLLLLAPDGTLWTVEPDDLVNRKSDSEPFEPLSREALAKELLAGLPRGFDTLSTRHYLICHNTSRDYATWCGTLFERLHRGFTNFWTRKGFKLHDPEFPLVAVVFGDKESYAKYAAAELGKSAESIVGYYSLRTNRVTMYDLSGLESLRAGGASAAQINRVVSQPEAEALVATVIHEATHQIAFNSGLQTRYSDIPLWVSEGIAMYFETPDLGNDKGWRTIGAVNGSRLVRFRDYLASRPAASLKSLISDDKRLRDPRQALDAYAEAWALTYYLIRQHPKQYVAYLHLLSQKKQLLWDDPNTRLEEFQSAFRDNLGQLDADFVRQMQKLR